MWKKYCRVGQATDGNMAPAPCLLDTKGYKYAHWSFQQQQQWLPRKTLNTTWKIVCSQTQLCHKRCI